MLLLCGSGLEGNLFPEANKQTSCLGLQSSLVPGSYSLNHSKAAFERVLDTYCRKTESLGVCKSAALFHLMFFLLLVNDLSDL